ncbi:MAG: hypothetical protein H7203_02360 [Rhizobacter sp.]|nr:hypothetical protein [Burkholderiales bacterium]
MTASSVCVGKPARSSHALKPELNPHAPKTTHGPFALSAAKGLMRYPSNPSPLAQGERKSTSKVRFDGSPSPSPIIPFMPKPARDPFAAKPAQSPHAPKPAHSPFALSAAKGLTRYPSNPSPLAQGERKSTNKVRFDGSP